MAVSVRLALLLAVLGASRLAPGAAQSAGEAWLQCKDAAVSENGARQSPDPRFEEILVIDRATRSVAWYSRADRVLTRFSGAAQLADQTMAWSVDQAEPTGQCSFVSRTQYRLHMATLRYASENSYTMMCRDKPALTHVTRRDATCRAIEALPVALRRI